MTLSLRRDDYVNRGGVWMMSYDGGSRGVLRKRRAGGLSRMIYAVNKNKHIVEI